MSASHAFVLFFFYFLFFMRNVSCACALFTESINFFFLTKLSLKKGSTTLFTYLKKFCFGIFSFQQNKRYPNTPLVLSPSHQKKRKKSLVFKIMFQEKCYVYNIFTTLLQQILSDKFLLAITCR